MTPRPMHATRPPRDARAPRYGAVAAPGWILPAGAVLAIATAGLVPLALQGGDDAQKQMAEDAKDSWGKSNQDTLNKRR